MLPKRMVDNIIAERLGPMRLGPIAVEPELVGAMLRVRSGSPTTKSMIRIKPRRCRPAHRSSLLLAARSKLCCKATWPLVKAAKSSQITSSQILLPHYSSDITS
jgi:hypothetical protein